MDIFKRKKTPPWNRWVVISTVLFALVVIWLVLNELSRAWLQYAWFNHVDYGMIYRTNISYQSTFLLGSFFFYFIPLVILLFLIFRYRDRHVMAKNEHALGKYRQILAKFPAMSFILFPAMSSVLMLFSKPDAWSTYLLWKNQTSFGVTDPQFHKDLSFYVFTLPFLRLISSYILGLLIVSALFIMIACYLFGGIDISGTPVLSSFTRKLVVGWASCFLLMKAFSYWLDHYELLYTQNKPILHGATYTTVNALIPAKLILLFLSIICVIVFLSVVFSKNLKIAAFSVVVLFISSFIFSFIWPASMEKFSVHANEIDKESEYIARNIAATHYAYNLQSTDNGGTVQIVDNWSHRVPPREEKNKSNATINIDPSTASYIRVLDPQIATHAFTKLKGERQYYSFSSPLTLDRYTIQGKLVNLVLGARELDTTKLRSDHKSWSNEHLVFTHGNGVFAANATDINHGNTNSDTGGDPLFYTPKTPENPLYVKNPRIYYGPVIGQNNSYAVVGGHDKKEWDSPQDRYRYEGTGISIGSSLRRIAMGLVTNNWNFLLSKELTNESQLLFKRDPRQRVHELAPWLMIDPQTYPVVLDHKLLWVVDGYTYIKHLPYSQHISGNLLNNAGIVHTPLDHSDSEISYIRNSVKATVDAYTGEVNLYQVDKKDPILHSWEKVYPHLIRSLQEAPEGFTQHFRYPIGLLNIQRYLLQNYHFSSPADFFQQTDTWSLPKDDNNTKKGEKSFQEPYYFTGADPRTGKPAFQLGTVMLSSDQSAISAAVSVSNEPETYGQMTLRILRDQNNIFPSPEIAVSKALQTTFGSDKPRVLSKSRTVYGTILAIALSTGNILYIQPIYLQSPTNNSVSLYRVLLYTTQQSPHNIGYGSNTDKALKMMGIRNIDNGSFIPIQPSSPSMSTGSAHNIQHVLTHIDNLITQLKIDKSKGDISAFFADLARLDAAIDQWRTLRNKTVTDNDNSDKDSHNADSAPEDEAAVNPPATSSPQRSTPPHK